MSKKNQIKDLEPLYEGLMELYIHQNELLWSRLKVLLTIETAFLSSGYFLRDSLLSFIIMFSSIIFLFFIRIMYLRDILYRDKAKSLILIILNKYGLEDQDLFHVKPTYGLTGTEIFFILIKVFVPINIFIGFLYVLRIIFPYLKRLI